MWSELSRWAGQVLVLVVLFTVADTLMPEGALRGTVRTVMGVAVVAAVLGPVVELVDRTEAARWELERRALGPAHPSQGDGTLLVDESGFARSLWDEAVAAAGSVLTDQVHRALNREGLATRAVVLATREPSGSAPLEVVLEGPLPLSPQAVERARQVAARAAGLPEWAVSVRLSRPASGPGGGSPEAALGGGG